MFIIIIIIIVTECFVLNAWTERIMRKYYLPDGLHAAIPI